MKTIKPLIFLLVTGAVAHILLHSFWFAPNCEMDVIQSAESKDGKHKAQIEVWECKDLPAPILKLGMSNQTTLKTQHEIDIGVANIKDVSMAWLSDNELHISYPNPFPYPREIDGVRIKFNDKIESDTSLKAGKIN